MGTKENTLTATWIQNYILMPLHQPNRLTARPTAVAAQHPQAYRCLCRRNIRAFLGISSCGLNQTWNGNSVRVFNLYMTHTNNLFIFELHSIHDVAWQVSWGDFLSLDERPARVGLGQYRERIKCWQGTFDSFAYITRQIRTKIRDASNSLLFPKKMKHGTNE